MDREYHDRDRSLAVSPLAHVIEALGIEMPQKLDTAIETSHVVSDPDEVLAEHYTEIIRTETKHTVESVLRIGRTLAEAKAALGNKRWLDMVETNLAWKRSSAYTLMKIAAHPALSSSNMLDALPGSWGTLELLARLEPEEVESGVARGAIHSGMTRREAREALGCKRNARDRAEQTEQALEAMAAPKAPPPSPASVLRGIAEETGEVFAAIEVLHEHLLKATDVFGEPRKKVKEYGPAEYLDDLLLSVQEARDALGVHYDDLAQLAGLPTREQS